MKTLSLLLTVAVSLFAASALHAQTAAPTPAPRKAARAKTTSTFNGRGFVRTPTRQPVAPTQLRSRTDGSVVRAARSGNALQMINPAAPAEYGNGQDVTRHDPDDPYQRPQGLKLFVVEF